MIDSRPYYLDSYTRAFAARRVAGFPAEAAPTGDAAPPPGAQWGVILESTYFYPASGGQPADHGTLNGVPVIAVTLRASDGAIVHWLEAELSDDEIQGAIDWPRRWDHMQQHTGQHILSQAFIRVAEAETISFHLGADSVSIDLAGAGLTHLTRAEDLANEIIQRNLALRAWFPDDVELRQLPLRREPKVSGAIRVVAIGDFDFTACGGTHLAHTGELGLLKILGLTKVGKDTHITFICGERARRDYHRKHTLATQLAAGFSVDVDEVEPAVARLRAENQDLRRALTAATAQLLDAEAAALRAATPATNGIRIIRRVWAGRAIAELRGLAERLTQPPDVIALLGGVGEKSQLVFARSANLDHHMGTLIKPALAQLGGNGGGSPALAQGGGGPTTLETLTQVLAQVL